MDATNKMTDTDYGTDGLGSPSAIGGSLDPMHRHLCLDCGRPISLSRSGWWQHDGMPDGCWRLSLDGPNDPDAGYTISTDADGYVWLRELDTDELCGPYLTKNEALEDR